MLETPRLRLEPWTAAHTGLLAELSAMPEVVRFVGDGTTWSAERAEDVAARQREHWAQHGFGWRAAVERASGAAVGLIAFSFLGEGTAGLAPEEYEIGWWLHPSARGRGLAREGAIAVRDDAFSTLGVDDMVARIQPPNRPSIRLAEALGGRFELATTGRIGEPCRVYRIARPVSPAPGPSSP